MSNPILPLLEWPSGIQQASVPANENALRNEALSMPAIGVANDAPGTEVNGDIYIVGDTPTGAFAEFDEYDIALYRDGWHAWAPVEGVRLVVADVRKLFDGAEWIDDPAGGGSGGAVDSVNGQTGVVVLEADDIDYDNLASGLTATDVQAAIDEVAGLSAPTTVSIVTEGSAFTVVPATHSGLAKYVRAAANATFDSAETYTAGLVFNIRATAAVELLEDGVTLTPPAGGTLELDAGMSVAVIMTSGTAGDVIGQTVAA